MATTASAALEHEEMSRDRQRGRGHGRWVPYAFVGPAALALFVFGILPIGVAAVVSLTDMNIRGLADPSSVTFIGLENYARLFTDSNFWRAMSTTGLLTIVGVPVVDIARQKFESVNSRA